MPKKITVGQIIMTSLLLCVAGLLISWIAGVSPRLGNGYDTRFFHTGLGMTISAVVLLIIHLALDRRVEILGYVGALLVLFLVFGYIPLRMIYWSVPEPWVLIVFPALIVPSIALPFIYPQLSGTLEREYLLPSTKWGRHIWWWLVILGPAAGSVGVLISRMARHANDYALLSIFGLIVYVGMLWTIQANVHNNIYMRKIKREEGKDG